MAAFVVISRVQWLVMLGDSLEYILPVQQCGNYIIIQLHETVAVEH